MHEFYKKLQSTIQLDTDRVPEEKADLSAQRFNTEYLMQNRACVIRDYGSEWTATKKWPDKEYLAKEAGFYQAGIWTLNIDNGS